MSYMYIKYLRFTVRQIKILRQMSQCLGSSLENDIRLHVSGSEKVVLAQRNPLAEMYPNAVFRNFEQEKVDECLEVSRQRSQLAAHIVFCRACASFMMSLGRGIPEAEAWFGR